MNSMIITMDFMRLRMNVMSVIIKDVMRKNECDECNYGSRKVMNGFDYCSYRCYKVNNKCGECNYGY